MKKTKKMFALVLACMLILSLSACNLSNGTEESKHNDVTVPTETTEITNSENNTITEPTEIETLPNVPSETVASTETTESNNETNDDVFNPAILYDDFGKDNDYFQKVLDNMRNYTGTIVVRNFDDTHRYSKVDYKNKYVLDYDYSLVWSIRYVDNEHGYFSRLGSDNSLEHDVPIDFYANIKGLDKYDYVKIGNVLYGAEKSILTNCHLIKIYLTEDGLIQSYVTSSLVKYDEWNKNWDDSEIFSVDKITYEYSADSLI